MGDAEELHDCFVPGSQDPGLLAFHLRRYEEAAREAAARRVLDLGCGSGYGSQRLAWVARSVVAVDLALQNVRYARRRHFHENIRFGVNDARRLPFKAGAFELVTCFEVYEHLAEQEALVAEVRRVLAPGGVFFVSTPNIDTWHLAEKWTGHYDAHVREVGPAEFVRTLRGGFRDVRLSGMRTRAGGGLHALLRKLDVFDLRLRLVPPKRRDAMARAVGGTTVASISAADVEVQPGAIKGSNILFARCS